MVFSPTGVCVSVFVCICAYPLHLGQGNPKEHITVVLEFSLTRGFICERPHCKGVVHGLRGASRFPDSAVQHHDGIPGGSSIIFGHG